MIGRTAPRPSRIILLLALALGGCASLPDAGPFVDASNQLRSAVAASGRTVEAELRLMPDGAGQADQLRQHWAARNQAFAGMAAYAESVRAIIEAGNAGAASAEKVADSVSRLAGAAGIALPGSAAAVAAVTDIGKLVSEQIARARGAKSLERALSAAQPAVDAITQFVAADLADAEKILIAASTVTENQVRAEFGNLIGYRKRLLNQIEAADPGDPGTLATQVQHAQLLHATEPRYSDYLAQRKAISDRLKTGRALIQASIQSAEAWSNAHGALATAVQERRVVNADALVQAALELQGLIRKVREL